MLFITGYPVPHLCYRQGVGIAILDKIGLFHSPVWQEYGIENVATGLQDFIICLEMFVAAIVHYFVFSHKPFIHGRAKIPCLESLIRMLDIRDVGEDVKEQALHFQNRAKDAAVSAKNVAAKVLRVPGKAVGRGDDKLEMVPLLPSNHNLPGQGMETPHYLAHKGAVQYNVASTEVELPPSSLPSVSLLQSSEELHMRVSSHSDSSSSSVTSEESSNFITSSTSSSRSNVNP